MLPLVLIIVLGIALIPISTILFVNSVSHPTSSMLAIPNRHWQANCADDSVAFNQRLSDRLGELEERFEI